MQTTIKAFLGTTTNQIKSAKKVLYADATQKDTIGVLGSRTISCMSLQVCEQDINIYCYGGGILQLFLKVDGPNYAGCLQLKIEQLVEIIQCENRIIVASKTGVLYNIYQSGPDRELKAKIVYKIVLPGKCSQLLALHSLQGSIAIFGKGLLPHLISLQQGIIWSGKNVPNDQLDLQVPINDVGGFLYRNLNNIEVLALHVSRQGTFLRAYKTHKKCKPFLNLRLNLLPKTSGCKVIPWSFSEKMIYSIVGCQNGEVYIFKLPQGILIRKYSCSIPSAIVGLKLCRKILVTATLSGHVKGYCIQDSSKSQLWDFYCGKNLRSIACVVEQEELKEKFVLKEENLQQQQDDQEKDFERVPSHKVKPIRKRNKVGLRYLQPREVQVYPYEPEQESNLACEALNSMDEVDSSNANRQSVSDDNSEME